MGILDIDVRLFSYSGMTICGLILGTAAGALLAAKQRLRVMPFLYILLLGFLPLFAGAKLFGVLSLAAYRISVRKALDLTLLKNAGIVYYGGVLFFAAYLRWAFRRFLPGQAKECEATAFLLIPLFHAFARIGCYMGGCCYGTVSASPLWASFFEHRVPVQLMEAVFEAGLFLILLWHYVYRPDRRGQTGRLYFFCYAVFRFVIEFWRGDALRGFIGPLSFSQWISIFILICMLLTRNADKRGVLC